MAPAVRDSHCARILQTPWQRIIESTESLAQSHETLAQKIEVDAEIPLRQFATKNQQMLGVSTVQGNLASIAKDFDAAQKKSEKLKDKAGRTSSRQAANTNAALDDASQQWESQAPYVFEQLQTLDETRIDHLRDVLTQFQTHEIDNFEQNRKPAELCLNALLNLETADEIKIFAARVSTDPPSAIPKRTQSSTSNQIGRFSTAVRGETAPSPPPPRPTADTVRSFPSFLGESGQQSPETGRLSILLCPAID
jgi:F-BAR domain only protein